MVDFSSIMIFFSLRTVLFPHASPKVKSQDQRKNLWDPKSYNITNLFLFGDWEIRDNLQKFHSGLYSTDLYIKCFIYSSQYSPCPTLNSFLETRSIKSHQKRKAYPSNLVMWNNFPFSGFLSVSFNSDLEFSIR